MNLRVGFPRLQLIFLLGCLVLAPLQPQVRADVVVTNDGRRQEGRILGLLGTGLQLQIGIGTIGVPLGTIKEIVMAAPPEVAKAQQLFLAKDYAQALTVIRSVTDKYRGLPVEWAQQSLSLLGDVLIATNDISKAEIAYRDFQRLYPGAASIQADVGIARVAISRKDFATARVKLQPIADAAMKEKTPAHQNLVAYSQAFYALGMIKEAEKNLPGALEDYLRTVTLFYHDPAALGLAQERADALITQKVSIQ